MDDDIDTYTSTVLFYIKCCMDNVITTKQIQIFPNNKPWMTKDVRLLLKVRNAAFRSGDSQQYRVARRNLKRGIRDTKARYRQRVEHYFGNSDTRRAWQGLRHITRQNQNSSLNSSSKSLAEDLNNFLGRFEERAATLLKIQSLITSHSSCSLTM